MSVDSTDRWPLKDCNLIEAQCRVAGYCSGHTSKPKVDSTDELDEIQHILHNVVSTCEAVSVGEITEAHAEEIIHEAKAALQSLIEDRVREARKDEWAKFAWSDVSDELKDAIEPYYSKRVTEL